MGEMIMTLEDVKAGDELLLRNRNTRFDREPRVVTVVKVGRTLVYIPVSERYPDGQTLAYRIDTGYRNDNYRHTRLETREQYEENEERARLQTRLRDLGIELDRFHARNPSLPRLRALVKVMEDESL